MIVQFPCYTTNFPCFFTLQEAMKRIAETVACHHNKLKVIETYYTGIQKITLSAHTGGYVYYNSFLPIANIEMRELDGQTHVSILFELQKSTKIFMSLFAVFALLFEITLIILWIMNQLTTHVLLCMPLLMMILSYILCNAGLYFSSKGVLRILFAALACENIEYTPSIHKSKYIGL